MFVLSFMAQDDEAVAAYRVFDYLLYKHGTVGDEFEFIVFVIATTGLRLGDKLFALTVGKEESRAEWRRASPAYRADFQLGAMRGEG